MQERNKEGNKNNSVYFSTTLDGGAYFDQHLGAVHFKCWSASFFCVSGTFFVAKMTENEPKKSWWKYTTSGVKGWWVGRFADPSTISTKTSPGLLKIVS